jgi:hypothetical protein
MVVAGATDRRRDCECGQMGAWEIGRHEMIIIQNLSQNTGSPEKMHYNVPVPTGVAKNVTISKFSSTRCFHSRSLLSQCSSPLYTLVVSGEEGGMIKWLGENGGELVGTKKHLCV